MWEAWVQSLGGEDPLEKGMSIHSSILAWRIPMDRGAWWSTVCGDAKMDMTERLSTAQYMRYFVRSVTPNFSTLLTCLRS